MRVLVLTFGDAKTGSTYFRIGQYDKFLRDAGLQLTYITKSSLERLDSRDLTGYDVLFNQKCLISPRMAQCLIRGVRRIIFDFDDAIYTRPGRDYSWLTRMRVQHRLRFWLNRADVVTVANHVLGQFAERYCKPRIVPMALDLSEWKPRVEKNHRTKIVIGWTGAPVNQRYLADIVPSLTHILATNPGVEFRVFSGKRPELAIPFNYHPFEPEKAADFVRNLDIGLLPLANDTFSRAKSPIKAVQYLASGVPVVANRYGATCDILNSNNSVSVIDGNWEEAFRCLIDSPARREKMSASAREFAESNHDRRIIGQQLLTLISGEGKTGFQG